jgi:hypothetical protein
MFYQTSCSTKKSSHLIIIFLAIATSPTSIITLITLQFLHPIIYVLASDIYGELSIEILNTNFLCNQLGVGRRGRYLLLRANELRLFICKERDSHVVVINRIVHLLHVGGGSGQKCGPSLVCSLHCCNSVTLVPPHKSLYQISLVVQTTG